MYWICPINANILESCSALSHPEMFCLDGSAEMFEIKKKSVFSIQKTGSLSVQGGFFIIQREIIVFLYKTPA